MTSLFSSRPSLGDWIGAVSVALVLIPQSIAYATIAGLPPEAGLFAATLPLIIAAPFVSCPWLQTGPVALTSLLTFGALASFAFENPADRMAAASILALIVGATRLLLGVRRLGGFTKLFSPPVVLGFTTAAAILIISSQIPKTLGTINDQQNVLQRAFVSITQSKWSIEAITIALATGSVAYFGRYIHRLFPSVFVAVILAILYAVFFDYAGETIGELPGGFISLRPHLPWENVGALLFPGLIIAFVGFAEPASISMTLMKEENREWNANRELFGGGLANIASGLIGGYPVGGSFSRTSINKFAGATSAWSGLITGTIVLSLLWLIPFLKSLPKAALGAVIIVAVIRLIKPREIWQAARENWIHGSVAVITLVATLASAPRVDVGILIGAALGILVMIWEKSRPSAGKLA